MKLVKFSIPDQMDAWEALESTDGVKVEGVYRFDSFVIVKYSIREELLDREIEAFSRVKEIAEKIKSDPVLPSLKNAMQRELYLLDKYNVDSQTALKAIEYLKVQELQKQ